MGGGMLVTAAIRDVSDRVALESGTGTPAGRGRTGALRAPGRQVTAAGEPRPARRRSRARLQQPAERDRGLRRFRLRGESLRSRGPTRGSSRYWPTSSRSRSPRQQAARLTRQLLAFARHEVNTPEIIDLNQAVDSAGSCLRRALGAHIDLAITAEPALWRVKADRGQLEQVLVNLAVNARDAMPGGGRLIIDTANVEVDDAFAQPSPVWCPGRYARLRVSDNGMGMDKRHRRPCLRTVLHDQAEGPRDRSRAGHRLRRRDAGRRQHRHLLGGGDGHDGQRAPSGHRRTRRAVRRVPPRPADDSSRAR